MGRFGQSIRLFDRRLGPTAVVGGSERPRRRGLGRQIRGWSAGGILDR
jgi:hypothetical protein